jgi:hypothetical protein
MRSTSMSSSHPKSGNALPLRWRTCMASSTSTLPPFPVGRPWTPISYIWMTAKSSTNARSISPGPNLLSPIIPIARSTGIFLNICCNARSLAVSPVLRTPLRGVEALGQARGGRANGRSQQHLVTEDGLSPPCSCASSQLPSISLTR